MVTRAFIGFMLFLSGCATGYGGTVCSCTHDSVTGESVISCEIQGEGSGRLF